jgi:GTP cyclohydrolase IA
MATAEIGKNTKELSATLQSMASGLDPLEARKLASDLLIKSIASESPQREGLLRTPERFAKAMGHLFSGYESTPESVVGEGVFSTESRGIVSVNDIEFFSLCEHHMLPFWGHVAVAYYPSDRIIGLSKIPRIVNLFSRRLQVQEHLTHSIAESLQKLLKPRAVAVRIRGQHLCMMMRGVEKQQSFTVTESALGLNSLTDLERTRLYAALDLLK